MAGESQQTPRTEPDPSVLTTEQLERAVRGERDYVDGKIEVLVQRLDDRDEATKVLQETVTRVPTDVQQAVSHLQELVTVKFDSVALQFDERDTRSERESKDNTIKVDAAFAAAKELAALQNLANQVAGDKSEKTFKESIDKMGELFNATTSAQNDKIDDLKTRIAAQDVVINGLRSEKSGAADQRIEARQVSGASSALIFGAFGIIGVLVAVAAIVIAIYQGGP